IVPGRLAANLRVAHRRHGHDGGLLRRRFEFDGALRLVGEDVAAARAFERLVLYEHLGFDAVARATPRTFDDQAALLIVAGRIVGHEADISTRAASAGPSSRDHPGGFATSSKATNPPATSETYTRPSLATAIPVGRLSNSDPPAPSIECSNVPRES